MSDTIGLPPTANYVELDWYDASEVVQVRPRDRQRFELQKDRAIEVLQAAKEADRFQKQFELLLNKLAACMTRIFRTSCRSLTSVSRTTWILA